MILNQIIGIITGILIGIIIGKSKPFESMKLRLLVSILFPIVIWILVGSVVNSSHNHTYIVSSENIFNIERVASSLGKALGRFFFGYLALGITIFSIQSKRIKKVNEQGEINEKTKISK